MEISAELRSKRLPWMIQKPVYGLLVCVTSSSLLGKLTAYIFCVCFLGTPPRTAAGTCPVRGDKCALLVAVWPPCLVCLSAYLRAVCLFFCLPRERDQQARTTAGDGLGTCRGRNPWEATRLPCCCGACALCVCVCWIGTWGQLFSWPKSWSLSPGARRR